MLMKESKLDLNVSSYIFFTKILMSFQLQTLSALFCSLIVMTKFIEFFHFNLTVIYLFFFFFFFCSSCANFRYI